MHTRNVYHIMHLNNTILALPKSYCRAS